MMPDRITDCDFHNSDNKPCQRESNHTGMHNCTDPDYRPIKGVDYACGYNNVRRGQPCQTASQKI